MNGDDPLWDKLKQFKSDAMNVDLSQQEIQLIIRNLPVAGEEFEKLGKKLLQYVFPEVDQDTIAEKWQDWKRK